MNPRVVLNEESFKALSADSRINILKNLKERRKTLSELSKKLNLGNSTVKEHCDILVKAGLITQIDEGRKWKYYELTQKGKRIVSPSLMEEAKILIILSLGAIIFGGIILLVLNSSLISFGNNNFDFVSPQTQLDATISPLVRSPQLTSAPNETKTFNETSTLPSNENNYLQETNEFISNEFYAVSIILSMIMGIILGWVFLREK